MDLEVALATISAGGRRFRRARLSVRNSVAKIIIHQQGRPAVAKQSDITDIQHSGNSYSVTTSSGETWTAIKTGGCGCGGQKRVLAELNAYDAWGGT